jgi:hypothetical protein
MLPPWMIEKLERDRREQAEHEERARVWIEIPAASEEDGPGPAERDSVQRGVIVVEVL